MLRSHALGVMKLSISPLDISRCALAQAPLTQLRVILLDPSLAINAINVVFFIYIR